MPIPFLTNFRFASPWWLLLLLALPVLAWLRGRRGDAPTLAFPTVGLLEGLGFPTRSRRGGFMPNLLHLCLACAIVAMARPQKVISYDEVKSEGIAICVAIDVSRSMLTEDYYAGSRMINRIDAAKRVLRDFVEGRPNDRIGIVAFAGAPYTPCPPTLDHDWILKNLGRIQIGLMEDGTAIGSGIATAARRLDPQEAKSKVIVLITDGANNSGKLSPRDAARAAATLGIRIYAIGVGTPGHHTFRDTDGMIRDSGREEFDPASLREIAAIGNGKFFAAQDSAKLVNVFQEINEMEKSQVQRRVIIRTEEYFAYCLVAACACGVLYVIWRQTLARAAPLTA